MSETLCAPSALIRMEYAVTIDLRRFVPLVEQSRFIFWIAAVRDKATSLIEKAHISRRHFRNVMYGRTTPTLRDLASVVYAIDATIDFTITPREEREAAVTTWRPVCASQPSPRVEGGEK